MVSDTFTMELTCPTCGRTGLVTYRTDPRTVPVARAITATGSYRIEFDGRPVCECRSGT